MTKSFLAKDFFYGANNVFSTNEADLYWGSSHYG